MKRPTIPGGASEELVPTGDRALGRMKQFSLSRGLTEVALVQPASLPVNPVSQPSASEVSAQQRFIKPRLRRTKKR